MSADEVRRALREGRAAVIRAAGAQAAREAPPPKPRTSARFHAAWLAQSLSKLGAVAVEVVDNQKLAKDLGASLKKVPVRPLPPPSGLVTGMKK